MASALCLALSACAALEPHPGPPLTEATEGARVLFIGAHPDDETLVGPLLAHLCLAKGHPCRLVLLTRGEGGRCDRSGGCGPDLAVWRTREMERVASGYGAELVLFDYPNAKLPWSSFPTLPELEARWRNHGDIVRQLESELRRFRPTLVFTFDPAGGFTGHPEHQLSAQLADRAVALAADPNSTDLGPAHHVERVYRVLNHYWLPRLLGTADEASPNEVFDSHVSCRPFGGTCLDVALDLTKLHESQTKDMALVRSLRPQMGRIYLQLTNRRDPVPRSSK